MNKDDKISELKMKIRNINIFFDTHYDMNPLVREKKYKELKECARELHELINS